MLARRVIAISPDKAIAKQLGTALKAAGGAVETHQSLDALGKGELQAALVVVHLDGEIEKALPSIAQRLAGDARLIVVVPKHDLISVVDVMRVSDRVAGVLVADGLEILDLASMATRILAGDIFGLEKLVPWGTKVYSTLVGDYQEKSVCIAQMSEFAELMGVRRKYREAIEQCVDEMLMNALYDAPVDDQGKQIFAEIPTKTRISLRMEQKVVVQYACDGKSFSVSVRDSFGTLERDTVVKYLHKCLHSDQQIDRKTGGAGLGLYLMANSSTHFLFNVLPGVATECVCSFDLETPKLQLDNFGFFLEKIDAAGRLAAGPSRLLPAGASYPVERRAGGAQAARTPTGVLVALSAAIVLMLVLIALVAYPRLKHPALVTMQVTTDPPGATIDVDGRQRGVATGGTLALDELEVGHPYHVTASKDGYTSSDTVVQPTSSGGAVTLHLEPHAASVTIDSDPQRADVLIDGEDMGKTPVTLSTLKPLSEVDLVLKMDGYLDSHRKVKVPGPGAESQVSQSLTLSPDFATIVVASTPLGAEVYVDGQRRPGVTPTDEIVVEAGKPHHVTLRMARFMPAELVTSPPRGARRVSVGATLAEGAEIHVEANVDGKGTVAGVEACKAQKLPFDCPVPKGDYTITIEGSRPLGVATRKVTVDSERVDVAVQFGFVDAPEGKKLVIGSAHVARAAFEEGKHLVTVLDEAAGTQSPAEVTVVAGRSISVP